MELQKFGGKFWFGTRKEKIPSGETKEVTVLASWTVTWKHYLEFGWSKPKFKAFVIFEEAQAFKAALEEAYNMIQMDKDYRVEITQN